MDSTDEPIPPPEQEIRCPECGALIGLKVTVGRRVYIQCGHLLVAHAGGYCLCGARLYWSNGQRQLEQVLEGLQAISDHAERAVAEARAEFARMAEARKEG